MTWGQEKIIQYVQYILDIYRDVLNWSIEHHQEFITIGTVVLLTFLTVVVYDYVQAFRNVPNRQLMRVEMSKKRRKQWVNSFISYIITEAMEEAYYKGKITTKEKLEYYQMIGSRCNMPCLLPKKWPHKLPDQEELKAAIKSRIKGNIPVKTLTAKDAKISLKLKRT